MILCCCFFLSCQSERTALKYAQANGEENIIKLLSEFTIGQPLPKGIHNCLQHDLRIMCELNSVNIMCIHIMS